MQNFIFNSPHGAHDQRKQAIIAMMTGQGAPSPTTMGQGAMQGASSIAGGLALRNHNRGPFPDAPGEARPSFMQGLMNFFGRGGGGLY
jgi:hypothetical protein